MSWLSGFFDKFLFNVAAIAAVLTAFDWLVGEDGRKKLRERVGDFWTALQYQSLDELYVTALQRLKAKLAGVYGEKVLSARFILAAFAANVLWVALSIVALLLWTDLGEVIASAPSVTYIGIGLTMLVFSLALGWYPIANFFWVVRRLSSGTSVGRVFYLPLFVLSNAVLFLIVAVVIVQLAWVVLISGAENFTRLGQQVQQHASEPGVELSLIDTLSPFLLVTFFILIPISALPFFMSLLLVLILACLKLLRPLLQPVLTLLLERLYESKQGVLTQIAWILVAVSKAVQEMLK